MSDPQPARILIVEDERIVALDLKQSLDAMDFQVVACASNPSEAVQMAVRHRPDLILMDINLHAERDGIDAAAEIGRHMDTPVIFLTAYAEPEMLQRASQLAPYGYLVKPIEMRELNATACMALARHQATRRHQQSERRLRMALRAARMGVLTMWPHEHTVEIDGHLPMFGPRDVERLRMPAQAFLDRLGGASRDAVAQLIAKREDLHMVTPWTANDGTQRWLEVHAAFAEDENAVVGVCRDVTAQVQDTALIRQAAVVFESAADAILILDADNRVVTANPAFTRLTNWDVASIRGRHPDEFLHADRSEDRILLAQERPAEPAHAEVMCRKRNGEPFPAWEHVAPVADDFGRVVQRVLTFTDISALRYAEGRVRHLAYHDTLTGLGNRHQLEESLTALTSTHAPLAILFLDLDGFKTINDTLGHAAGDLLLMVVADRIRNCLRKDDQAVRLGGDEFVLLAQRSTLDDIDKLTERLLALVRQPVRLHGEQEIRISSSIGVALHPEDGNTPEALLRAADVAMYAAKGAGRNRWARYSPQMSAEANERLQMEQGLARAMQNGELALHWQPLMDLATGRPIGNEVLMRWQSRQLGTVTPDRFIAMAEEIGLIGELGRWAFTEALGTWADRNQRGLQPGRLAINMSALQLQDSGFARFVQQELERLNVPAAQVEIEITETTLFRVEGIERYLRELHDIGLSVALDDFGTGQSSLAMLKHLPLHRLKIDRSFVRELVRSASDQAIVRAIAVLAKSLGLVVIAEGVETEGQRALLHRIGVTEAQGWLFAKAMPPDEWTAWWETRIRDRIG